MEVCHISEAITTCVETGTVKSGDDVCLSVSVCANMCFGICEHAGMCSIFRNLSMCMSMRVLQG